MPTEKQDYLKLCNELGVPFEDFEGQFCSRCLQVECGRSQHGKSQFEQRVATWRERLFENPPRMDPHDERYRVLTAKKFLSIDAGPIPEVGRSAWVDPRDLDEPAPQPQNTEEPQEEPVQAVENTEEEVTEAAPQPTPEPLVSPMPMNTPNRTNAMVGPAKLPVPVADPWEPKRPSVSEGQVVKPGAKIRMGGAPPSGV
jgi:hypothetical protein